jgi:solute carrier family 38 (sodium-coupled neutral amino acid transporter), member 10
METLSLMPEKKRSLAASVFNLCNTTLGAGVVSIPYFYAQCGVLLGTVILIIISAVSVFCNFLLVSSSWATDIWSFGGLAKKAYGDAGTLTFQICMISLTIGVMSAYYVQLGETGSQSLNSFLPKSLENKWYTSDLAVKAVCTLCPIFPFVFQRKLSALAMVSLFVVVVILYLAFVVCYVSTETFADDIDDDKPFDNEVKLVFFGKEFFTAVPIVVLAFSNSLNVHEIVSDLERPTPERVKLFLLITNFLVTVVYMIIGIAGYSHFGNKTQDNIIVNYSEVKGANSGIVSGAEIGLVIVIVCSYPMVLFPCRACLDTILRTHLPSRYVEGISDNTFFYGETFLIVATTFTISVLVPVLGTIMGYTGAIAGTLMTFTFPAMYNCKLVKDEHVIASVVLVVVGMIFTTVCLVAQVLSDS